MSILSRNGAIFATGYGISGTMGFHEVILPYDDGHEAAQVKNDQ
jgi:hypothetical protein